jgi:hypothetical protein
MNKPEADREEKQLNLMLSATTHNLSWVAFDKNLAHTR